MPNAIERGATIIAAKPMTFAGRKYLPGDLFPYKRLGIAHRRTVDTLLNSSRKLVELTQASMATALRFRPMESRPPRGFTLAGLLALGYLTPEQINARGWNNEDPEAEIDTSERPEWVPPEGSWKVFAEGSSEERSTADTTLWIVPFKTGGPIRYFVHGLDGQNLNGEGSIGGKAKAEEWARNHMKALAEKKARESEDDIDWSAFPDDPDDWSDEQVDVFDAWYSALPEGAEVKVQHAAVMKLYEERLEAMEAEKRRQEGGDQEQQQTSSKFDGLSPEEARELIGAMTDEELQEYVAEATQQDRGELSGLTRQALEELALEDREPLEAPNGSDVQSGSDDAAGQGPA